MLKKTFLSGQATNVAQQVIDSAISVGKAALHCTMPDDIEYYLCSLELVDCEDKRLGFLSFSVMPEQIVESHSPIQTMIKTNNAVVTNFNSSFSPIDITIAGTFGRKFRLLLNYKDPKRDLNTYGAGKNGAISLDFGSITGISTGVKSGYGMTKILQHILEGANCIDVNGKPLYVKFCNYSLNTAYIVDVVNFSFSQSMANNCMWNYSFTIRAVARLRKYDSTKNKLKELIPQVAANSVANGLTNIINGMMRAW